VIDHRIQGLRGVVVTKPIVHMPHHDFGEFPLFFRKADLVLRIGQGLQGVFVDEVRRPGECVVIPGGPTSDVLASKVLKRAFELCVAIVRRLIRISLTSAKTGNSFDRPAICASSTPPGRSVAKVTICRLPSVWYSGQAT
jgi:hypothetical protein